MVNDSGTGAAILSDLNGLPAHPVSTLKMISPKVQAIVVDFLMITSSLVFCNRTLGFVNAPALMQHAVQNLQQVTVSVAEYQKKRDFLYGHLVEMGYSLVKPQGAFYMFPKSPLEDDVAFVNELQQWNVLAVPGRGFGSPGHFRLSYCVSDRTLEGSLAGFKKAAQKLNLC